MPPHEAGGLERGLVLGQREVRVHAGAVVLDGQPLQQPGQRAAQLRRILARADQQPRSGHRRERDRRQQLRVVGEAGLLAGPGPAPVEYELAPGVGLQVLRNRGHQPVFGVPDHDVPGLPAGAGADAVGGLERLQEGVPQERVCGRIECVPLLGPDPRYPVDDLRPQTHQRCREAGIRTLRPPAPRGTCRHRVPPCSRNRPR